MPIAQGKKGYGARQITLYFIKISLNKESAMNEMILENLPKFLSFIIIKNKRLIETN